MNSKHIITLLAMIFTLLTTSCEDVEMARHLKSVTYRISSSDPHGYLFDYDPQGRISKITPFTGNSTTNNFIATYHHSGNKYVIAIDSEGRPILWNIISLLY